MIITQGLSDIYKPIRGDLERFGGLFREALISEDGFLQSLHEHLLSASGKHLRAALAVLSARLGGEKTETPIRIAVAIELLHMATLIHDDIIDGAEFRRNQASLNARWGTEISLICGDYLYAKAFSALSGLEDPAVLKMFSACAKTMCEGELKQVETRKNWRLGEADYMEIIMKKTASLFQAACAAGGYLAQLPVGLIQKLGDYGKSFGMVYQITDDCLDLTAGEEETGKTAARDYEKSDPTLPFIYFFESLDPVEKAEWEKRLSSDGEEKLRGFNELRLRLVSGGALERCMAEARSHGAAAAAALKGLQDNPYRKSLADLLDFVLQRVD